RRQRGRVGDARDDGAVDLRGDHPAVEHCLDDVAVVQSRRSRREYAAIEAVRVPEDEHVVGRARRAPEHHDAVIRPSEQHETNLVLLDDPESRELSAAVERSWSLPVVDTLVRDTPDLIAD